MEENRKTMWEVEWELKKRKLKEKVKETVNDLGRLYYDNEEMIRTWAPVLIPAAGFGVKHILKQRSIRNEERNKELYHWDPRRGEYYMSRRPLKSSEQLELDRLYSEGYSKGEALKRMKLLK